MHATKSTRESPTFSVLRGSGPCSPLIRWMAVATIAGGAALAAPAGDAGVKWHDLAEVLPVEGAGWKDTATRFDRLPATAESMVRPEVWALSQDSAGLQFRFETDATTLHVRWKLRRADRLAMTHMAATGVSGLDLYVRDADHWQWLAAARPETADRNERTLVSGLPPGRREFLLYLPLYNGIEAIELGLPEGSVLATASDRHKDKPPIVFYGTSITQGGCASRPGMAYPAILGRKLDWPVINLGFSGNGKAEPEMAKLVAALDAAAFVIDPLGNLTVDQMERVEPFLEVIRNRHPTTPIILVEGLNYPDTAFLEKRRTLVAERNSNLRKLYDQLKAAGDAHLHYIASPHLLGGDGEDTVDGTHPTDLGFARMAEGMLPVLSEALGVVPGDEADFESLFDGETLSGWKRHEGMPPIHRGAKWTVEDGAITGIQDPPGTGGLLWLDRKFTDFILRFQIQLTYPMDTGVFLRVGPTGLSHQVCLDYRPGSDVGAIFIPFVGHKYVSRFADGARLVDPHGWNDVEVRMEGEPARIRVWLNGRMLTDFQHRPETTRGLPKRGGLAFQVHPNVEGITAWKAGNAVRVRKIRIKELNRPTS